jgi:putative membrane protein
MRGHRVPLDQVGEPPDERFTYANERTLLAWNRTALALIVAGLAIVTFLPRLHLSYGDRLIGVPLVALGSILSILSYRRWEANERAMRLRQPLPISRLPLVLAIGVGVVAAVAAVVAAFGTPR